MTTPTEPEPQPAATRRRWPRPETVFLSLSLFGTVLTKLVAIRPHHPDHLIGELAIAALTDVTFFAAVAALFALTLAIVRRPIAARVTLAVSVVLALWSLLNAAWLKATGVQLQPAVLEVAAAEASASWDIVVIHVQRNLARVIPLAGLAVACAVWFVWRLVRPTPIDPRRARHLRFAAVAGCVAVLAFAGRTLGARYQQPSVWGEAVGFSSHWTAISRTVIDATTTPDDSGPRRVVPAAGQREVRPPESAERPNVVVIFLESVFRGATSLHDAALDTTPHLARLAEGGVELASTRVPVPLTSSAFWVVLTGNTPDLTFDAAEAALMDEPYDGLPSQLARAGYRSAFFQMATGAFEATPSLIANLGFDHAWFREDLGDESANLGYMCGDDFRMLEPMFDWVDGGDEPFLLTLITSISHDPYELPDWYADEAEDDPYGRYLQTVRLGDEFLGEVMARLQERGLLDRTLLCVIGDHGDSFRPEASRLRWAPFEEVIRVPWVLHWPGRAEAGRRIEGPCSQLDALPTMLSLLGFDLEPASFEGRDALQPIEADRRLYFSSWYRGSPRGYLEGSRKYMYWPLTDRLFAYDLEVDPGESSPEVVSGSERQRVLADVREWMRSTRMWIPPKRFRSRLLYDSWRTMSVGRHTTSYYEP